MDPTSDQAQKGQKDFGSEELNWHARELTESKKRVEQWTRGKTKVRLYVL